MHFMRGCEMSMTKDGIMPKWSWAPTRNWLVWKVVASYVNKQARQNRTVRKIKSSRGHDSLFIQLLHATRYRKIHPRISTQILQAHSADTAAFQWQANLLNHQTEEVNLRRWNTARSHSFGGKAHSDCLPLTHHTLFGVAFICWQATGF